MDLLYKTITEEEADIVAIQEPNIKSIRTEHFCDNKNDTLIMLCKNTKATAHGKGDGIVWVIVEDVLIISGYISPNCSLEDFNIYLNNLGTIIRHVHTRKRKKVIIMADFNAKSYIWGSDREDRRGEMLCEFIWSMSLAVANVGDKPTFTRNEQHSIIDVTLTTDETINNIQEWRVSERETLSDHNIIIFEMKTGKPKEHARQTQKRYKFNKHKEEKLIETICKKLDTLKGKNIDNVEEVISKTCEETLKNGTLQNKRKPVYWWSTEINELRNTCIRNRRMLTRLRGKNNGEQAQITRLDNEYRQSRKKLKEAIKKAKERCWKELIEEVDNDVWGNGYKIVTKKHRKQLPTKLEGQELKDTVDTLFPNRPIPIWTRNDIEGEIPNIKTEEVLLAAKALKDKKAPGEDGIPPEVVKIAAKCRPEIIAEVMTNIVKDGRIPKTWKRAKLVLLPKPGKNPPAYRPICLLPTMAKLFEGILRNRIMAELEVKRGISEHQYGFIPGKSTIDAINEVINIAKTGKKQHWSNRELVMAIALDVKNAFNSASWEHIINKMKKLGIADYIVEIIKDYFTDREIGIDGYDRKMSCGVPQGSVIGPILWNIVYNGVLELNLGKEVRQIAYADDLILIITAKTEDELEFLASRSVQAVESWMRKHELELAAEKTEAMLITGRKKIKRAVNITCRGRTFNPSNSLKYLGVLIDKNITWIPHLQQMSARANQTASTLLKLMPRNSGPNQKSRKLLYSVVISIALYGAPVWAEGLKYKRNIKILEKLERRMLIYITQGYKTISTDALQVVASMPPLELLAKERAYNFGADKESKNYNRKCLMDNWTKRWRETRNGEWTKSVIKDLETWVNRKFGEVDYFLTQALTGHGDFGTYLKRIQKSPTNRCEFCMKIDDPKHTLFECEEFADVRDKYRQKGGVTLSKGNFINTMLRDENSFNSGKEFCKDILTCKEERRKQY